MDRVSRRGFCVRDVRGQRRLLLHSIPSKAPYWRARLTEEPHLILVKNPVAGYLFNMVKTLNISLTPEQVAWINAQKVERGFATASDVVRDMIRDKQEEKWRRLEKEFEKMNKRDGAAGPEPVDEIVAICRQVKRKLLKQREGARRP